MSTRYDFGRNWSDFATRLDDSHLDEAIRNLARLVGDIGGCTFLDIGCGSGLHSAAALKLGAKTVRALDYDDDSVKTTKSVLEKFAGRAEWYVEKADVLDSRTLPKHTFDVVYSWGVLHHTGDMWQGIRNAAALVSPGGRLCLALYIRTPFCKLWTVEKRIYSKQLWLRPILRALYTGAFVVVRQLRHGDARDYIEHYKVSRGMNFMTDVDDWLGGYPYQSVKSEDLVKEVCGLGFELAASFNTKSHIGLLGTGCGEWLFVKPR